jgi:hypothetical protein
MMKIRRIQESIQIKVNKNVWRNKRQEIQRRQAGFKSGTGAAEEGHTNPPDRADVSIDTVNLNETIRQKRLQA